MIAYNLEFSGLKSIDPQKESEGCTTGNVLIDVRPTVWQCLAIKKGRNVKKAGDEKKLAPPPLPKHPFCDIWMVQKECGARGGGRKAVVGFQITTGGWDIFILSRALLRNTRYFGFRWRERIC